MSYADFLASYSARATKRAVLPSWLTECKPAEPLAADEYSWNGKRAFIYGLVDPRTNEIRYIGKTQQSPNTRLRAHMLDRSNCHRVHWLQELAALGLEPNVVLFEAVEGAWPWQESERYWIAHGRKVGWRLTNNTSGGDGVPDLPPESRERIRQAWIGRKHSPETLAKIGAASKLRRHTDERRARMREKMKGRVISWIDKISEANRKLSESQCDEIRSRIAAGETSASLADEFGVHRTTIQKVKAGRYLSLHQRDEGMAHE